MTVRVGVHHLLVNGKGVDMGIVALIEALIEAVSVSRALWSLLVVVRHLGGAEMFRRLVRWSINFTQSAAWKLRVAQGVLRTRGISRVVRIGRWSVLGPCRPGLVSQLMIRSEVWLVHQMLSGLVQLPVECARRVG